MTEPDSRFFRSGRLNLHYAVWGDESKPPVVLVHGSRDHNRNWEDIASELCDNYSVYAPDLRGHGDSDWAPSGSYQIADYVADLARLVEVIDRGPVYLVGHSLGGRIAPNYTAAFPHMVRKVVSIEGLGGYYGSEPPAARLAKYVESFHNVADYETRTYATLDDAVARMQSEHPRIKPELARHLTTYAVRRLEDGSYVWKFDPYLYVQSVHEWSLDFVRPLWEGIHGCLLYIGGSDSWERMKDRRRTLGLDVPEVRTVVIADAGHWVHHDQPAAFLQAIDSFFQEA